MDKKIADKKIDPRICGIICQWSDTNQPKYCTQKKHRCDKYTAILALIEQEQKPMVEALKEKKEIILETYTLYMPVDIVIRMLDSLIADAVLPKGEGK
jgi:hypothetical protein